MLSSRYKLVLQFFVTFCALAIVPSLYFYSESQKIHDTAAVAVEQSNRNKLEYSKAELQVTLTKINTSLRSLASNGLFNQAIVSPTESNLNALKEFWLLVTQTQGVYAHLRFLDTQGQELIRINSSERVSEIVNEERLQYKGDRDYFHYAQTLRPGELGVYGIDLQQEHGKYVMPLKPAYRIIIPVALNGAVQGYFIANLDLPRIYKALSYKRNSANLPSILDQDGFYLLTNTGDPIFGNVIKEHRESNLANQYPTIWSKIKTTNSGTDREGDTWISYSKAELSHGNTVNKVIFVIRSDANAMSDITRNAEINLAIQATFLFVIIFLITLGFVTWNYNHEKNSMASKIARAAMNGMSAMVITDHNNRIIQVNEEFTRVSGYELEDVIGKQPSTFASGKHNQEFYMEMWKELELHGIWEGEVVNKRRDGSKITEILRIQTVKDKHNVIQFYVASFIDITHRKELENRLRELSERDPLTGLWNRRKFDAEMSSLSLKTKRYPNSETATLALLDIDHFKRINDTYGHDKGDVTIKEVARILTNHLRETDVVARIGGEEFAIIMPHTPLNEAEIVINRVRTAIHIETSLNITISGGITEIGPTAGNSYKRADIALYESKTLGRNQVNILSVVESDSIA
ncbi:diguanylate cyclase [Vibrio sinaloensis]|uniref:sensor domain-containing diguanylate cyclase n=1 Tax=Photobacterium sp. (strain ATCC 43367) TaxID=379097 RepID=UPI00057DCE34|nr:diguanylate cyclase [Vibrio sinaloensis]KHT47411.1 diguanylate cyclase [Vibrio sinaloensis]